MNTDKSLHASSSLVNIFDSKIQENKILFQKITGLFSKFGLSNYESYIYIFLVKNGLKTAPEIFKSLSIPRTETYRILTKLQGKGLVTSSFDHPMTYTASSINKVIESLINQEKNRVKELEAQKQEMIELFRKIPSIGSKEAKKSGNQFQILQGCYQINNKIKEMLGQARVKFLLIGSQFEFLQFHNDGIFEILENSSLNVKILFAGSKKIRYYLQEIKKDSIKMISEKDRHNLSFAIKDGEEIVFFMKDGNHTKENQIAIWSDSSSIVTSLDLLFNIIWHNYKTAREAGKYTTLEKMQQEYKFKLKELEQENIALATLNRLLSNNKN